MRSLAVCRRALPALAHSRLVRVAVQDPAFGQDHVFTATLLGLAAQYPGVPKILISCADDYTALLARHADALRGAYRFACPPPAALHLADKRQFAAACRAAGLRTPQTVTLCPADALPPLPFPGPVNTMSVYQPLKPNGSFHASDKKFSAFPDNQQVHWL